MNRDISELNYSRELFEIDLKNIKNRLVHKLQSSLVLSRVSRKIELNMNITSKICG